MCSGERHLHCIVAFGLNGSICLNEGGTVSSPVILKDTLCLHCFMVRDLYGKESRLDKRLGCCGATRASRIVSYFPHGV